MIAFILANSVDPDEMLCLCQTNHLQVSSKYMKVFNKCSKPSESNFNIITRYFIISIIEACLPSELKIKSSGGISLSAYPN